MLTVFQRSTAFTGEMCFNCCWWSLLLHLHVGGRTGARKFVSCLRILEKNWTRWDAYMCWTLCSNVVQTQMKEIGYNSFSPHCVCKNSCILNWDELFSSVGQFLGWSYLVLHFYGNVCYWIPKLFWPRLDWFWLFCWNIPHFTVVLSLWTEVSNICSLVFLFWRHEIFSINGLRAILVSSLKVPLLFNYSIFLYQLIKLAKQSNFIYFVLASYSFFFSPVVMKKLFDYLWKSIITFPSFFNVKSLLMFYIVYCRNVF